MSLLVSGNEAGDLDSVAAAVALSKLLQLFPGYKKVIPVVRSPRLKYHDDHIVVQAFDLAQLNIDDDIVFCTPKGRPEDSKYNAEMTDPANKLLIIDYNAIDEFSRPFWESQRVTGLLDHHEDVQDPVKASLDSAWYYNEGPTRASTCSIVAELILWKMFVDKSVNFNEELTRDLMTLKRDNNWHKMIRETATEAPASQDSWRSILKLMLVVLIEDSKAFQKDLKNVRWVQADRTVYKLITEALEMSERDLYEFVFTVKDIQKVHRKAIRKLKWPQLLMDDQKIFTYPNNKIYPWSSIPASMSQIHQTDLEDAVKSQLNLHACEELALITRSDNGRELWLFAWPDPSQETRKGGHQIFDNAKVHFKDNIFSYDLTVYDIDYIAIQFDDSYSRKRLEPVLRSFCS